MRVSRQTAQRHHEEIVGTASRLFREKGFDAVGVAELMAAAGLTHGGFYGHFRSKAALSAEATSAALAETAERWAARAAARPDDPLGGIVDGYLTAAHRDAAGSGCAIASLATDVARAAPEIRHGFTEALRPVIAVVETAMPEGTEDARTEALGTIAAMMGAMVLARAVDDPELSEAFLTAGRRLFGL